MVRRDSNSLDLLRLIAAVLVLYSHQFALLGSTDPSFFGWTTFGGAGVTIFFFLSGMLVWSSWDRDSDSRRFFQRRTLRIFPALWVAVVITVFLLGPFATTRQLTDYFGSTQTWRYFTTAVMVNQHSLPGVFADNPYPTVINGSLWTLPVEFLCYVSVALVGSLRLLGKGEALAATVFCAVIGATYAPLFVGARFSTHFEMVAVFWFGALYGYCMQPMWRASQNTVLTWLLLIGALLGFAILGERGVERTSIVVCAAVLVHLARQISIGAKLTNPLGDISYGLYIYAFPVQQTLAHIGSGRGWNWSTYFSLSVLITGVLAYASWNLVERRVMHFKPRFKGST
jgi:peptidoglycan/LPS O-acetylase OafA/YrhL